MATTHFWFGTERDNREIVGWMEKAGATYLLGKPEIRSSDISAPCLLHFPQFGEVRFWTNPVNPDLHKGGSPEGKRAILAQMQMRDLNPDAKDSLGQNRTAPDPLLSLPLTPDRIHDR